MGLLEPLEGYEFTDKSTGMSQSGKNDVSIYIDGFIFDGSVPEAIYGAGQSRHVRPFETDKVMNA
jgi:hypothetical protein